MRHKKKQKEANKQKYKNMHKKKPDISKNEINNLSICLIYKQTSKNVKQYKETDNTCLHRQSGLKWELQFLK